MILILHSRSVEPIKHGAYFQVTPWGMRKLLAWVKKTYNDPAIIITENGYSDNGTYGDDEIRQYYYKVN